jgi:MbtH protein
MSSNPFDDPDGTFHVLVNDEGQHSLWPTFVPVPLGWQVALSAATRQDCLDHIEEHWTDLRPRSLRRSPAQAGQQS